jgi:AcrR family transcriptional regulator
MSRARVVSGDPVGGAAPDDETKYARTRGRILDAAAYVLSRKGYAGTRLSDVAERVDIQTPAIYYYFASRDDLIEEVMASGLADMRVHLQATLQALPPGTPAIERILVAAETHLRHELEISDYTTASIRNRGQIPSRLRARADREEDSYGALWRQLFDEAACTGQLRSDVDCWCSAPSTGRPSGGTHAERRCTPSWPTPSGSSGVRSNRAGPTRPVAADGERGPGCPHALSVFDFMLN